MPCIEHPLVIKMKVAHHPRYLIRHVYISLFVNYLVPAVPASGVQWWCYCCGLWGLGGALSRDLAHVHKSYKYIPKKYNRRIINTPNVISRFIKIVPPDAIMTTKRVWGSNILYLTWRCVEYVAYTDNIILKRLLHAKAQIICS